MAEKDYAASKTGVAVVSLNHTLAWVNSDFADIVGYAEADLFGKTFESITHADDIDLDRHLCDRLFAGEIEKYEMEKRYLHRDGTVIPIHLGVSLVRDRSGKILYALSTVEKINQRTDFRVAASAPLTPRELELDRIRRAVLG